LEEARPCTLLYLAYRVVLLLKKVLPFRKLKPNTKKVIATMATAPTLVSFDIFTW
jgi:hypothetical protein